MSEDLKSIHEFDYNLICDYFANLERQGPGSNEITLKALSFIENLNVNSHILDIGCGTGGQTMTLAMHTSCKITGIDLFPSFVELFNKNTEKLNLQHRVKAVVGSMDNLPFSDNMFDLIWSEGAIYNIGFERGLKEWRRYLKPDAYIAVSEVSWFTTQRPHEIETFWHNAYPEIDTIPNKVAKLQNAGFIPIAVFVLPENCWISNFYNPQLSIQEDFLKKHSGNHAVEAFIASERHEMDLYHQYKAFYGYVFYIGKKL